jgi:hypothetical protein
MSTNRKTDVDTIKVIAGEQDDLITIPQPDVLSQQ